MSETAIRGVALMYEARDAMRTILGEKYAERTAEWGKAIRAKAEFDGQSDLKATMEFLRRMENPHAKMLLLASYVELVEPSVSA